MHRRDLFKRSAWALGLAAGVPYLAAAYKCLGGETTSGQGNSSGETGQSLAPQPLAPPAHGAIPVAFVLSKGAVVIDFCGPWEVLQDVQHGEGQGFQLYTVAETSEPIAASGGMTIVPNFTFQSAPQPKVVVIPAQDGASPALLDWIRRSAKTADITMSICTGAYVLAKTGLLAGKAATTHHDAYAEFAMAFPDIHLRRGARFVEDGKLASSGGLSAGIDLALRVVERYYGHDKASQTAYLMEYQGQGWLNPDSNQAYAKARVSTDAHPVCPICSMDGDPALKSVYQGRSYYFCSATHKQLFDKAPASFVNAVN